MGILQVWTMPRTCIGIKPVLLIQTSAPFFNNSTIMLRCVQRVLSPLLIKPECLYYTTSLIHYLFFKPRLIDRSYVALILFIQLFIGFNIHSLDLFCKICPVYRFNLYGRYQILWIDIAHFQY